MTKIFKQLARHWAVCLVVFALLFVQAYCDLSLPDYTSKIVDTGIQQGGIESPLPATVRQSTLDALSLLMREEDAAAFQNAYTADGDVLRLRTDLTADERTALEDAVTTPDIVLYLAAAQAANTPAGQTGMGMTGLADLQASGADRNTDTETETVAPTAKDLDTVCGQFAAMSQMPGFRRDAVQQQLTGAIGQLDDTVVENLKSQALLLVGLEYEAQGIAHDMQMHYLYKVGGQMLALTLLMVAVSIAVGFLASRVSATIGRDLRRETFNKVMHFSPAEVGKFSQASLITRCTNDIQQIQMAATLFIRMCLMAPVMGIVAVMRVLANHTGLEWTIAVAIIAVSAVVGVLMGLTMPKFKKMQSFVDRVNLTARELLDGLMPIRSFNREEHELERFDKASLDLMTTQLYTNRAMSFMMPLMMLVMNCITVLIVWFGAQGVSDGVMQVGNMMAFISYTMQIVMAFMILTMVSVILPRAEVAAERVEEVITCPTSINDPSSPKLPATSASRGELTFRDVSFQYPDARADVISGVNFTTHAGQMLGIIGSTGSGKSTLVQLIPRLYDVTGGSISLDGIDVRDMTLSELRRRIGYIPQQGRLFSGTVESNLKFAGDMVSDEDMRQAARVAQAEDFIAEREGGYDSPISQGGSNVSGGQRQRLAIARALAKKPEVVVFDDSFSALDYKTDARLREELAKNVTDAALVVVAQRIATIMHADQIIVLDDGHVVGTGTHEELLRSCPAYLEIAQSQLSAEELGLTQEEIAAVMEGGER